MASLPISIHHPALTCPRSPPSDRCFRRIQLLRRVPTNSALGNNSARRVGRVAATIGGMELLSDDGYSSPRGIEEYTEAVDDLWKFDRGPPRWFCPTDCGPPMKDAPLLLFLPGIDGIGLGLFMHHKALGRIFEVRCMHVPLCDRTPFEGLVKFVEDVLRLEHSISQSKPIYLIGHSFGGCLALSVAARNPNIDMILILSNPATSLDKSQFKPCFPSLRSSNSQNQLLLSLMSFNISAQFNIVLGTSEDHFHPFQILDKSSRNRLSNIPQVRSLLDGIPTNSISWKLKLLKSAALYSNSRLHAIKAEVLVLVGCLDSILPSKDEARRFQTLLNSKVHYFADHGHNLLLENGIHLSSIIKIHELYRHSKQYDCVTDYLPPTMRELEAFDKGSRGFYLATSPVMFSTLKDGKIVRGLSGIPNSGPVLFVGNHMLLGVDIVSIILEFLREKRIVIRGISHPGLFPKTLDGSLPGNEFFEAIKLFGGIPLSYKSFYRLLSEKSFVLLYPGGIREALHGKGEEYKLFWPVKPEFVRMATQFGATIVPFGCVGEDDLGEMLLDHSDFMSMPIIKDMIKEINTGCVFRPQASGDIRRREFMAPVISPKIPGRFYYLFGKPIDTSENMEVLKDREAANVLYSHVKSEVESIISYLLNKRNEDDHRSVFRRILYQATCGSSHQIPTFRP